jgi:hypothetical protein
MKKLLFLLSISIYSYSQNVGIGNPAPNEKLDVTGNINLTGTIKANGDGGTANQVLMKNSANTLEWGDLCDYKNFISFSSEGSWTVPTGVTKLFVELWGAGGGGNIYAGGGGGGYIAAQFNVTPGDLIDCGAGIAGAGSTNDAINGDLSYLIYNSDIIKANGGGGAKWSSIFPLDLTGSIGGGFLSGFYTNYRGINGLNGKPTKNEFMQAVTNTYEIVSGGDGGNGANTEYSYGAGAYGMFNVSTSNLIRRKAAGAGKQPGGGGGSGYTYISSGGGFINGAQGGTGLVIIHY